MLGDRERIDVGVDAEEVDILSDEGNCSLNWLFANDGVDMLALSGALGVSGACCS